MFLFVIKHHYNQFSMGFEQLNHSDPERFSMATFHVQLPQLRSLRPQHLMHGLAPNVPRAPAPAAGTAGATPGATQPAVASQLALPGGADPGMGSIPGGAWGVAGR